MHEHIKQFVQRINALGYDCEVTTDAAQGNRQLTVELDPWPVSDDDAYVSAGRSVHPSAVYRLILLSQDTKLALSFVESLRSIAQVLSVVHQRQTQDYAEQTFVDVLLPYEIVA